MSTKAGSVVADYVLIDVTRKVLTSVPNIGPESLFRTFGTGKGPSPSIQIGIGDVLSIAVFESSVGGLFSGPENPTRRAPAPMVLPAQTVDHNGNITVPFAGEIKAAGRSAIQLQRAIEGRLDKRAIEPQVVVTITEQNATEVSIFGDATGSLKTKIRPGGERILDIVAKAGVRHAGYEVFVSLQRGDQRATVFLPVLLAQPEENIYVRPGDIIYVFRQPQNFVVVGALGNTNQTQGLTGRFTFDAERLSLAEGLARAGGLLDSRADPRQVFLYRMEARETLLRLGLNLSKFPPDQRVIPTIYRANFRDPSIFFAANQFPLRHRDIIYVGNADAIELEKFLGYIRLMTSTVAGVASDVTVTRDAVRSLGN